MKASENTARGRTPVAKALIHTSWALGDIEGDIAVLVLQSEVGQYTGWASLACLQEKEFEARNFFLSGFARCIGKEMRGKITKVKDNIIRYDIDTTKGQSGSPIWSKESFPEVVGIHARGASSFNEGIRISSEYFGWIKKCMKNWRNI